MNAKFVIRVFADEVDELLTEEADELVELEPLELVMLSLELVMLSDDMLSVVLVVLFAPLERTAYAATPATTIITSTAIAII